MSKLTPYEGRDKWIAEKVYRNSNLRIVLVTNDFSLLSDSTKFSDLTPVSGTGYSDYLFDTQTKLDSWVLENGSAIYNPQVKRDTLSANAAGAATSISTTLDWSALSGNEVASVGDTIGIELDSGLIHKTTIASIGASTIGLTDALPTAAASGNEFYVVRATSGLIDHRIKWTNSGSSSWSAAITGVALVAKNGTKDYVVHLSSVTAVNPGPGSDVYVNLRDSV